MTSIKVFAIIQRITGKEEALRKMARLGVNIDHVATLRQARVGTEPDPIAAAVLVELAGADGLVVHLREDRRHIQDRDLRLLREIVKIQLDLEMAPTDEMVKIALSIRPELVTLVPERRMELTTEGGLDAIGRREELQGVIASLQEAGILVSLFIEPDTDQIKIARKLRTDCVELHTGRYANAKTHQEQQTEYDALVNAVKFASKLNLRVHVGHGLNYQNVLPLTRIVEIQEFNIGHSIISRAVLVGLQQAVREMKQLISGA